MKTYRCWVYVEAKNIDEAIKKAKKNITTLGFTKEIDKKEEDIQKGQTALKDVAEDCPMIPGCKCEACTRAKMADDFGTLSLVILVILSLFIVFGSVVVISK